MGKPTHSIMPHGLAKALMEAGVQHFDGGGLVGMLTPQSNYQAALAPTQTSNYGNTIDTAQQNALAGYGQSQNIQAQQQQLANALMAQSRGEGPNPAQAQLANATGANVSNQAALMASQRGAGANAGLMARQAAMQGGALQQNAVGQGAAMQAQQQINAQNALGQQQGAMQSANLGQQNLNANLFGTAAGAQNAQNNTAVANYGMQQGINAGTAAKNSEAMQKTSGGLLGGLASGIGSFLSKGGVVPHLAGGGYMPTPDDTYDMMTNNTGVPSPNEYAISMGAMDAPVSTPAGPSALSKFGSAFGQGFAGGSGFKSLFAKGGNIPEHLHHIAKIYHPEFASGGSIDFRSGGPVPGQAQVKGDSEDNDTVPAMVSPGEVVLPRSVTQSGNAPDKAAEFVRHLQEKEGKQQGYKAVADSKKSLKDRVDNLEKLFKGGRA